MLWRVLCLRQRIDASKGAGGASVEADTETFDAIATRTLGVGVAPMVVWAGRCTLS